jgi:AmmeMemoRadiSam system protein A
MKAIRLDVFNRRQKRLAKEDPYIRLARVAIEYYVRLGRILEIEDIKETIEMAFDDMLHQEGATFVTIEKNGKLRGCIGTVLPVYDNLIEEIMSNAIQAASADPRFMPIRQEELEELEITVDELSNLEVIGEDLSLLDPDKYGLVAEKGKKKGLLLPGLKTVHSVEEQVAVVLEKAGLSQDETGVVFYRFTVTRHEVIS